jgi:hypothetical protein
MTILDEDELDRLFNEKKILPRDYHRRIKTNSKSGTKHEQKELTVEGESGHTFSIALRKNRLDPFDFSVILRYKDDSTGLWHNLARYNGRSHKHTNKLEGTSFRDFHIHRATQRYQENGLRIESFAEVTNRYNSFANAVDAFIEDFNFIVEGLESTKLLREFGVG